MCGISGTFDPGLRPDRGIPVALHDRLLHRGPDETYSLDTPALSAKLARLGMTGLTDGWQPAEDRGGRFVALTNGEIYNAGQLWAELGVDPANRVDVAVVPELVARHGTEGLARIDGQFATVLLDRTAGALYLARDRFGICPLYLTLDEGHVHFCSELKPLVRAIRRTWRVDVGAVDEYFALGNIVAPRTLVEGIRSVPPGCVLRFDAEGERCTRYWRYGEFEAAAPVTGQELRRTLRTCVAARLDAEVEIGAYLSGGFDSSTLLLEAASLTGRPVRSFSVVFDDPSLDEGRFQQAVVTAAGSKHEDVRCRPADVAERFERMVRYCCFPQRESYNVAALMLSERVHSTGLKGVLSGEGADELFFGYDSYAFDSVRRAAPPARPENESAWGRADFGWEVDWARTAQRRTTYLAPAALEALAGNEFWRRRLIPFSDAEAVALSPMQLRSVADVYVQLAGHLLGDHGDAMLLAHSVEGRYPFLGNAVAELAQRMPDEAKVADFEGKAALKQAYRGVVPDLVLDRAKQGFTAYGLPAVTGERTWAGWRELAAASGLFTPGCLDEPEDPRRAGKWDFRVGVISVAMIVDELGLRW